MLRTTEINLLVELQDFIENTTPADVEWAARDLTPLDEAERPAGQVTSATARYIHAAGRRLSYLASAAAAGAELEYGVERQTELRVKAARLASMAMLARELFWAQTKDDLSLWQDLYDKTTSGICVRLDWEIVFSPAAPRPLDMFRPR